MPDSAPKRIRRPTLAVAAITLVGAALRVAEVGSNLYGDEVRAYRVVRGSLGQLFDLLLGEQATEATPPLYFLLAWASAHLGDSLNWIRLPSIVLGTATVPIVYAIGRKAGGVGAGLIAAALVALSPFAIFYSTEGRSYATMAFLVATSTLALLKALEHGERRWWVLYGLAAVGALYTHYTSVFVIAAQAAWALACFRESFRTLAWVHLGIVLAYVPWLPFLSEQKGKGLEDFFTGAKLNLENFLSYPLQLLVGHSSFGLGALPGRAALILLAAAAGVGLLAWLLGRPTVHLRLRSDAALVAIAAAATPVGVAAYVLLGGGEIYYPRNLTASLPALAVLVGLLVAAIRPPAVWVVAGLLLTGSVVATVRSLEDRFQRPPYEEMVHFIDAAGAPGDAVMTVFPDDDLSPLNLYSKRHYRQPQTLDDAAAWSRAARGHSVFLFLFQPPTGTQGPPPSAGPDGLYILREARRYPGLLRYYVGRYSGRIRGRLQKRSGREVITLTGAPTVLVDPTAADGFVDTVSRDENGELVISGWAIDAGGRRPADRLIAFAGGRLLASGQPTIVRPDVSRTRGDAVARSGFRLTTRVRGVAPSDVRVYAIVGERASQLDHAGTAP